MQIAGTAGNVLGWSQAVRTAQRAQTEGVDTTGKTGRSDAASFSEELGNAMAARDVIPSLLSDGGVIRIEDVREATQEAIADFRANLYQQLRDAGVDTSQEIQLGCDGSGNVRVLNGHPDADTIETIVNGSELANQFRYISANSSLIHACDRSEAFRREYAVDPEGAVARHAYLFADNSQEVFSLFLTEESARTHFDTVLK